MAPLVNVLDTYWLQLSCLIIGCCNQPMIEFNQFSQKIKIHTKQQYLNLLLYIDLFWTCILYPLELDQTHLNFHNFFQYFGCIKSVISQQLRQLSTIFNLQQNQNKILLLIDYTVMQSINLIGCYFNRFSTKSINWNITSINSK